MEGWHQVTKQLLKGEMVKRGVTSSGLVVLLKEIGVSETKASIESKISRGRFSAAFLLQCLEAMGCKALHTDVSVPKGRNDPA